MVSRTRETFAAILNSRQSKTPCGSDAWVARTLAAVDYAVRELDAVIVSSVGMMTWDLVTWRAGQLGAPVVLVVPATEETEEDVRARLCHNYGIEPAKLSLRLTSQSENSRSPKKWWSERDRTVIDLANILIPVSLRSSGALEELVVECGVSKTIDRRFATRHAPAAHHERRAVNRATLNPALSDWSGDFLIHWTRACHGAWPGETVADFCRDLVASRNAYCRAARHTLVRILTERCVRASSWHIGDNQPMVALTELTPIESLPHMRWRSRWARWSFEPYGVAIRRDLVSAIGGRPVRYVDPTEWSSLAVAERPYCHSTGKAGGFWPAEREWRIRGDLDLSGIPSEAMLVIVRESDDIAHIRRAWDAPVISMTE